MKIHRVDFSFILFFFGEKKNSWKTTQKFCAWSTEGKFCSFNATKHFHYFVIFACFIFHHRNIDEFIHIEKKNCVYVLATSSPIVHSIDFLFLPNPHSLAHDESFFFLRPYWLLIALLSPSTSYVDDFFILSLHFSCQKFVWIVARLNFMFE